MNGETCVERRLLNKNVLLSDVNGWDENNRPSAIGFLEQKSEV